MKNGRSQQSSQAGFSLIEVLVALLVFGVGVVGFAALQLKSVDRAEGTYSRSQAMSIAQDLIERAKANVTQPALAVYLNPASWTQELVDPGSCVVTNAAPTSANACSSESMAAYDVYQVRSSLSTLLVNGKINLSSCDSVYCVRVAWNETQLDSCDQAAFDDGERSPDADCVLVEFIP
ncbi:MAG: type IV pilus modification protein PilV [Ketobacter sp.]|nr:type IV pilus modification protein PilV [Ketobacter sp.]